VRTRYHCTQSVGRQTHTHTHTHAHMISILDENHPVFHAHHVVRPFSAAADHYQSAGSTNRGKTTTAAARAAAAILVKAPHTHTHTGTYTYIHKHKHTHARAHTHKHIMYEYVALTSCNKNVFNLRRDPRAHVTRVFKCIQQHHMHTVSTSETLAELQMFRVWGNIIALSPAHPRTHHTHHALQ